MVRFLKICLLWMLALALPVQGVAASMQLACGPAHHQSSMMQYVAAHEADHHMAKSESKTASAQASSVQASLQASSPSDSSDLANTTCSACATCCVGAVAPPSASTWSAAFKNSEATTLFPVALLPGVTPASLKRPPKHSLA